MHSVFKWFHYDPYLMFSPCMIKGCSKNKYTDKEKKTKCVSATNGLYIYIQYIYSIYIHTHKIYIMSNIMQFCRLEFIAADNDTSTKIIQSGKYLT